LAADSKLTGIDYDFVDDVARELQPGKFAVVAEIDEDSTIAVDMHMESIGGKVFRRAVKTVRIWCTKNRATP
jgi:uncharacterized membrane protein